MHDMFTSVIFLFSQRDIISLKGNSIHYQGALMKTDIKIKYVSEIVIKNERKL